MFSILWNVDEQRSIFEEIMDAVDKQKGGVFFYMDTVGLGRLLCGTLYQQPLGLGKNCLAGGFQRDCKFVVTWWENNSL